MIYGWLGITWGTVYNWVYLPFFIGLIIGGWWLFYKKAVTVRLLSNAKAVLPLITNYSLIKNSVKTFLFTAALLLLYLALLQPRWGKEEESVMQEGRDVFIILDVSRSMLAADKKPNRLVFAKKKIEALIKKLTCERIGLIIFSGSTVVQCPLTSDYAAFSLFLDQLDAETISSGTTALDQALHKALTLFNDMPSRKNKLVVLITDGEDFSSNLHDVKQEARAMNMNIFTLGVGTDQGAPIPIVDDEGKISGYEKDSHGAIVMSRLNEGILKALVQDAGGTYVHATDDNEDIDAIVNNVQQFEKEQFDDKKLETLHERYPYFIGLALLCLLVEWIL